MLGTGLCKALQSVWYKHLFCWPTLEAIECSHTLRRLWLLYTRLNEERLQATQKGHPQQIRLAKILKISSAARPGSRSARLLAHTQNWGGSASGTSMNRCRSLVSMKDMQLSNTLIAKSRVAF